MCVNMGAKVIREEGVGERAQGMEELGWGWIEEGEGEEERRGTGKTGVEGSSL